MPFGVLRQLAVFLPVPIAIHFSRCLNFNAATAKQCTADRTAALLAQTDAQGQHGYRYAGAQAFLGNAANEQIRNIYVKDTSQAAKFVFATQNVPADTTAFITAANANGQANKLSFGDLAFAAKSRSPLR